MAAQSTIVYAQLGPAAPQSPAAVAALIARQAKDSLAAGQYDVALKPLAPDDIREAIATLPSGHERLALDSKLILLDAGAMLAYAPYRARVLLTNDPFAGVEGIAREIGLASDALRVRLHDALLSAEAVISLGRPAYDAVGPIISEIPEDRMFPPVALGVSNVQKAPILVVNNEDERSAQDFMALLGDSFADAEFRAFDPATVFDTAWKAMLQFGFARSSLPGARLGDAWAGGVPALQLINRTSLMAQNRRNPGALGEFIVEHGKTGLLFFAPEEFVGALRDFLLDPLPARSVARGARRRVDATAQWDTLLKAILQ